MKDFNGSCLYNNYRNNCVYLIMNIICVIHCEFWTNLLTYQIQCSMNGHSSSNNINVNIAEV